jgi:hypothetical protein
MQKKNVLQINLYCRQKLHQAKTFGHDSPVMSPATQTHKLQMTSGKTYSRIPVPIILGLSGKQAWQ